jgi:hypothetical protein
VAVDDVVTMALIDSGNLWDSAISEKFAAMLGLWSTDVDTSKATRIGTAGLYQHLEVLGVTREPLRMTLGWSDITVEISPIIVRNLAMDVNLSGPFLKQHEIDQYHSINALKVRGTLLHLVSPGHRPSWLLEPPGLYAIRGPFTPPPQDKPLDLRRHQGLDYSSMDVMAALSLMTLSGGPPPPRHNPDRENPDMPVTPPRLLTPLESAIPAIPGHFHEGTTDAFMGMRCWLFSPNPTSVGRFHRNQFWTGPWLVLQPMGPSRYLMMREDFSGSPQVVSTERLAPYRKGPPPSVFPMV